MNRIVAIVGMPGVGKSEAAKYIVERYHYECVYFGKVVLEELGARQMEINQQNEKQVREELRTDFGMDVIAQRSRVKIDSILQSDKPVIIDGLYSFSEYKYLKSVYGDNIVIIAIMASKKIRYQRMKNRKFRPLLESQLEQRDFFEITNLEKAEPIALSDYQIINNQSLEKLFLSIDQFFEEYYINEEAV